MNSPGEGGGGNSVPGSEETSSARDFNQRKGEKITVCANQQKKKVSGSSLFRPGKGKQRGHLFEGEGKYSNYK